MSETLQAEVAELNPTVVGRPQDIEEALQAAVSKLTPKQAAFVQRRLEHKKESATESASQIYNIEKRETAASIASENFRKPEIINALDLHSALAEQTLVGTMTDWRKSKDAFQRELALKAAMYVHDKVHGKATQKIEQTSVAVQIDIDLS